jgi:hypothetical protein
LSALRSPAVSQLPPGHADLQAIERFTVSINARGAMLPGTPMQIIVQGRRICYAGFQIDGYTS